MFTRILLIGLWLATVPFSHAAALSPCSAEAINQYRPLAERYDTGLLFRIERCGAPASYVFGTFHSDNPKFLPTLKKAAARIPGARHAIFEVILDDKAKAHTSENLTLPPEHPGLKSLLGAPLYDKVVGAMARHGVTNLDAIERMKPWVVAVTLQYPKNVDDGVVIDDRLQRIATTHQVPLVALESVAEQFAIFDGLPEAQQVEFVRSSVDSIPAMNEAQEAMNLLYLNHDLEGILAFSAEFFSAMEDQDLADHLLHELINRRNMLMFKRLQPYLHQGGAFVAVGALHLPGNTGILRLLEESGYFITPL